MKRNLFWFLLGAGVAAFMSDLFIDVYGGTGALAGHTIRAGKIEYRLMVWRVKK